MKRRRVFVSGSGRGIGRAIALRLARDGFAITVHCRQRRDEAERVVNDILANGGEADLAVFDKPAFAELANRAKAALGIA